MASSARRGGSSWTPGALNVNILRPFVGTCAAVLCTLVLAILFLWTPPSLKWIPPADALPSFAGQTGLPCSACHVGGFGPQLTPFGINFRATGYTLRGGSDVWSHIPISVTISPSYQTEAKAQVPAPTGYGTNNFFNMVGSAAGLWLTGGASYEGLFGIGGFEQVGFAQTPGGPLTFTEATSDFKITKLFTLGNHSLLLGLDFTNQVSGGDPYNSFYNGFQFPFISPFVGPMPAASPVISGLGNTVYGLSLYAYYDSRIYAEVGLYQTWSPSTLSFFNVSASSLGTIAGTAPYFRLATQQTWGDNFLEIGGGLFSVTLSQIPGALTTTAQNSYLDWGFDATYQRTFGPDILAFTSNILFENQTLPASFAAGLSANRSNYLTQFRIAGSYYWNARYGATLAFTSTTGSTDSLLYAPASLTGSANGSPNSQAIVAQIDWTPFGNDTTHAGYPWLNVRIGLQYTSYLQFNGGTTNYDGSGRNASDNNTLLLFTWWAF